MGMRLLCGTAAIMMGLTSASSRAGENTRTPFLTPPPKPAGAEAALFDANLPEVLPRSEFQHRPFSMMGKVSFRLGRDSYVGSATLVGPKVALTAAHIVWDPVEGWSTRMRFERAKFGSSFASSTPARAVYLYSSNYMDAADRNPSSSEAFAWDVGWITFWRKPAHGLSAKAMPAISALRGQAEKRAMGYGADLHSGALPLTVTTGAFHRVREAYFESFTYGTEGGMSGGPLFARIGGRWIVAAVVVSGYYDYSGSGVRAVDRGLARALKAAQR